MCLLLCCLISHRVSEEGGTFRKADTGGVQVAEGGLC